MRPVLVVVLTLLLVPAFASARPSLPPVAAAQAPQGRPISTITSGTSDAAHVLAATFSLDKRARVEQMYAQFVAAYPRIERSFGLAPGDAAGAIALVLVAAYETHHDVRIARATIPRLVEQIRASLGTSSAFANATPTERRAIYEQAAIELMMLATMKDQQAEQLRDTARMTLAELAGGDADSIRITADGLASGRAEPSPAPAATKPAATEPPAKPLTPAELKSIVHIGATMNLATYDTTFYVLVGSGDAFIGMGVLTAPSGIAAYKREHPQRVTQWRKTGAKYEIRDGSRWERLRGGWDPNPAGTRLHQTFGHSTNRTMSDPSLGAQLPSGGVSFSNWSTLEFMANGRFALGNGHGTTTADGHTHTTASRGGLYDITGYTLTLKFDDGSVETHSLLVNSETLIYIDGAAYRH